MINHLDCLPTDPPTALNLNGQASFGVTAEASSRPQASEARTNGAAIPGQRRLSGNTEFRQQMTAICPCGQRHFWGGPVCTDCFAAAPEHIQEEYLIGTPTRREVAIQCLKRVAAIRAATTGIHIA